MKPVVSLGEAMKRIAFRHIKRLILEDPALAVAHIRALEKEWDRADAISLGTQRRAQNKAERERWPPLGSDHPIFGWNDE